MKTIVVGYDGTEASDLALERVVELAPLWQANVIVTSVESPVPAAGLADGYLPPAPVPDVELDVERQERDREERKQMLARARSYLGERGVAAEVASGFGPPVDEIIAVAEQHDADLIVVGTHEPGMLERLFRGSISQGVVRRAHCDVLVVHPQGKARE